MKEHTKDGGSDHRTVSRNKQVLVILAITLIIFIAPVLSVIYGNNFDKVNLSAILKEIEHNIRNGNLSVNSFSEALYLPVQIILIIIATSLLFRIGGIKQDTLNTLERNWLWKHILSYILTTSDKKKQIWSIYGGYFLLTFIMVPSMALFLADSPEFQQLVRESEGVPEGTVVPREHFYFDGALLGIPMITVVVMITRILSKLNLKILDSNIGIFVIAIFVSDSIFLVAAGVTPFELFQGLSTHDTKEAGIRGNLEIYIVLFIGSVIGTVLDWIMIEGLIKTLQKKFFKQTSVNQS